MKRFVLFAVACLSIIAKAEIPFVVGGKESKSYLLLDTNPTPTAQYAAQELAAYIRKITGVEDIFTESGLGKSNWNIVVGYGDFAKKAGLTLEGLRHDGFRLVTKGNTLYIYGVDRPVDRPLIGGNNHLISWKTFNTINNISIFGDAGTLYGVYYLLREYFGVRWFAPGDIGEVVPKNPDFIIPDMDMKVNPDFEYRLDYVTVLNLNNDFAKWYRRAGFGAPLPVEINHSFYKMNKYQKSHPEWFALLKDGKRDFNVTCEGKGSLCLSQPGLVEAFAKEAENYFKAFPEQEIFCVMPNDWFNQICECHECQAQAENDKPIYGKYSNYVWNFVNKVAKIVGKTNPDKFVACCAYNTYMMIPDKVELEPNIAVMQTKCVMARYDDFYRWRNDELAYQWARKTKRFYIWDYFCWDNTNPHLTGLPVFFPHWLETDVKNMKGVSRGYFIEAGTEKRWKFGHPAHNAITHYLTGRLLWNASLKVDDLLEEFYAMYFGPAAVPMRKYWTRAEALWCNMDVKKRGVSDGLNEKLYTPAALNELKGYLEEAAARAPVGSDYAARVKAVQKELYPYIEITVNAQSKLPVLNVQQTATTPTIDGEREPLWDKAAPMPFLNNQDGTAANVATTARVLCDKDYFYIFVECKEPDVKNLNAACTTHDSPVAPYIWDDDSIEIFISPDSRVAGCSIQIIANANGAVWDGCHNYKSFPKNMMASYESNAKCKTARHADNWTLEMAIPIASLSIDGIQPTKEWRFNICRNRWAAGIDTKTREATSWSPTRNNTWFLSTRFGFLKF